MKQMEVVYASPTYPVDNRPHLFRRLLIIVALLVVAALFATWLISYLTTGKLVITTSDQSATIVLNHQNTKVEQATGSLQASLHSGQYTVTITANSSSISRVVEVKSRSTAHYNLLLTNPVGVEPVSNTTASSIVASASTLYFLNSTGNLCAIDAANNQRVINSTVDFQTIKWVDTTFGIGVTSSGAFYTISNGAVAPLNVTAPSSGGNPVYAVSPDHRVYVAYGPSVYGVVGGSTHKIYQASGDVTALAASSSNLAVLVSPDNVNPASKAASATLSILTPSGSLLHQNSSDAFAASFSPSGKYLALANANGAGGEIVDPSLKTISIMPTPNITNPTWLDDTTLFYDDNDQIWRYNLSSSSAQLIANTPLGKAVTELSISDDKAYVYLGSLLINNSPVIERVGLRNQPVSPTLYRLQSIMPYASSGYFMSLVNFTKTTVLVSPLPPLTDTNIQYIQAATAQLQSLGIATTGLDIQLAD